MLLTYRTFRIRRWLRTTQRGPIIALGNPSGKPIQEVLTLFLSTKVLG